MDREERKEEELIPEAEMMDFWEEGSECVMYDRWDRIKDWFKRVWKKIFGDWDKSFLRIEKRFSVFRIQKRFGDFLDVRKSILRNKK